MQIQKFGNGCCTSIELYDFWDIPGTFLYPGVNKTTTEEKAMAIANGLLRLNARDSWTRFKIITTLVTLDQEVKDALIGLGFKECFVTTKGFGTSHDGPIVVLLAADPPTLFKNCQEYVKKGKKSESKT